MVTRTRTDRRLLRVLLVFALAPSLAAISLACGTDDVSRDVLADSPIVASADAPELRQRDAGYVFIDVGAWDDTNLQWPFARYAAVTNIADELAIMGRSPSEVVDVPPIAASSIEGLASAELLRELGRTDDSVSTAVYPAIANVDDELLIMGLRPGDLVSARFPVSSIEGFASAELLWELGKADDSISTTNYPVFANIDDELAIMGLRPGDLVSSRFPVSSIEGFASAELLLELGRTN